VGNWKPAIHVICLLRFVTDLGGSTKVPLIAGVVGGAGGLIIVIIVLVAVIVVLKLKSKR
jgi:hypothetical protein